MKLKWISPRCCSRNWSNHNPCLICDHFKIKAFLTPHPLIVLFKLYSTMIKTDLKPWLCLLVQSDLLVFDQFSKTATHIYLDLCVELCQYSWYYRSTDRVSWILLTSNWKAVSPGGWGINFVSLYCQFVAVPANGWQYVIKVHFYLPKCWVLN